MNVRGKEGQILGVFLIQKRKKSGGVLLRWKMN